MDAIWMLLLVYSAAVSPVQISEYPFPTQAICETVREQIVKEMKTSKWVAMNSVCVKMREGDKKK